MGDIYFDATGKAYVADQHNGRIRKYAKDTFAFLGEVATNFYAISGVFDSQGNHWAAYSSASARGVRKFNPDNTPTAIYFATSDFVNVSKIRISPTDRIAVLGDDKVKFYTPAGTSAGADLGKQDGIYGFSSIAIDPTTGYTVMGVMTKGFRIFDTNNNIIQSFATTRGTQPGQFTNEPLGITITKEGYIFAIDRPTGRIEKFAQIGKPSAFTIAQTGRSVTLNWTQPPDPNYARVVLRKNSTSFPFLPDQGTLVTSGNITSHSEVLAPGTYYFSTFAMATSNAYSVASTLSASVVIPSQLPPTNVTATYNGSGVLAMSWTNPGNVDFRYVEIQLTNPAGEITTVTSNSTAVSFNISTAGTYTYSIRAFDQFGDITSVPVTSSILVVAATPGLPTNLVGTATGLDIALSWTNSLSNFTGVTVVKGDGHFPANIGDGTVLVDARLINTLAQRAAGSGINYYSVFSRGDLGNFSAPATIAVTVDVTPPVPVTGLTATATGRNVVLNWTNPGGDFQSVMIRKSTDHFPTAIDDEALLVQGLNAGPRNDTNLADGTYFYSVFARDAIGNFSLASTTSVLIDTVAPAKATNPRATAAVRNVTLSWNNPIDDFQSVMIRKSNDHFPTSIEDEDLLVLGLNAANHPDDNLEDGTYFYSIFTRDATGNFADEATASVTIDTTAPARATEFRATATGKNVRLTWLKPGVDFHSAMIRKSTERFPLATDAPELVAEGLVAEVHNDNDLPDETYFYSIFTRDADGNFSTAATTSVTVDTTPPARASEFRAIATGKNVSLTWTNPGGDFQSVMIRKSIDHFPTSIEDEALVVRELNGVIQADPNLEDRTYFYSIFTRDAIGNFSAATTVSARVDTTGPGRVSNLNATTTLTNITLTWTPPDAADFATSTVVRHNEHFPTSVADGTVISQDTEETTVTNTNLAPGTYFYAVYAKDRVGNLSEPATISATVVRPVAPTPPVPEEPKAEPEKPKAPEAPQQPDAPQQPAPQIRRDTTPPARPTLFIATGTRRSIDLSWTSPSDEDFHSVMVRQASRAIDDRSDGILVTENYRGTTLRLNGMQNGTYHFGIFARDVSGNYSVVATCSIPVFVGMVYSHGELVENTVIRTLVTDMATEWNVGKTSEQTLTVTDTGKLTVKGVMLGEDSGSNGEFIANSTGAQVDIRESLVVGALGTGKLTNEGAQVSARSILFAAGKSGNATLKMTRGTLIAGEMMKGEGNLTLDWTGGTIAADRINFSLVSRGGTLQINPGSTTVADNCQIMANGTLHINAVTPVVPLKERTAAMAAKFFKTQSTGKTVVTFSSADEPFLTVSGNLTVQGGLKVTLPANYKPRPGDVINLFRANRISGQFATMDLPELDGRLKWDTSELYTTGVLKVSANFAGLIADRPLNFPNPFKRSDGTFIGYYLSQNVDMELRVYTWTGKEVFRNSMPAGSEGAHIGYNKVGLRTADLGDSSITGVFAYLLIANGDVIGKGKMVVLP